MTRRRVGRGVLRARVQRIPPAAPARPARGWLAVAVLAALVAAAPSASAHSDLDSSEPADGARLDTPPAWVVLRFSGPIEPEASSLTVEDSGGQRVDLGDLRTENAGRSPVLNVSLHPDLGEGGYLVRWKILSDDGHPNSGEFGFAVGSNETPPAPAPASPSLHSGSVVGRVLSYVGLAVAFGAAAWRWAVRANVEGLGKPASRALLVGAALHAAGALLLFKATLDSTGVPAGVLASSQVGRMLALRIVAGLAAVVLAGLAVVPGNPSRLGAPAATAFLVAAAVASASVGHAAAEGLPGLAVDAMHLVASATWVGGLVLLLVALRLAQRQGLPAESVRRIGLRFGTVALACVIVLVLSGLAATLVILGRTAITDPLHLASSLYGRLLLAKVAVAALMVALAAANRFVFLGPDAEGAAQRRLAALGPDGTTAGLRRTTLLEALLGLGVLVLAGFLTATSPTDHEAAEAHHDHAAALAHGHGEAIATASLISRPLHGAAMMLPMALAPLHDGHEGGGLFDWYNVTIGLVVLAVLGVVGFVLYRVAKRRRGE